ncbi:unknown [Lactobacillus phage Lb338-1]|uniref:Uncharacterized protein n=1 Tax=Lactobacillus phage Lb338-1 TaxID=2892342 RepID=C1KFB6_9CAUD|nr:hypothetical protein lb338_phage_6 [Lactobacillus phage Lb338-1]ACO36927.1 unknown [Lactobacillus phage Lb338-1]
MNTDELVSKIVTLQTAEKDIKDRISDYKKQLAEIVDKLPDKKYENEIATVTFTKGRLNRRVNYAGLEGYSELAYDRFVTESVGEPSLKITKKA